MNKKIREVLNFPLTPMVLATLGMGGIVVLAYHTGFENIAAFAGGACFMMTLGLFNWSKDV